MYVLYVYEYVTMKKLDLFSKIHKLTFLPLIYKLYLLTLCNSSLNVS